MDRRLVLGMLLLCSSVPVLAQQAPPAAQPDPQNAVKAFYNPRIKEEQRPTSQSLARLYAAAKKKSAELQEPVSGLDFDPTTGSQDSDDDFRKSLRYKTVSHDASKAVVEATMRVFKTEKPVTITYDLVFENNAWRVNDIANLAKQDGWRLSTMLIAGAKGE
jgi:hypothetical protein